jgi:hypothetical protein
MSIVSAQGPTLSKYTGYGASRIESETGRYWVFFIDKSGADQLLKTSLQRSKLPLSDRSIRRRVMRAHRQDVTIHDLPVATRYVQMIGDAGIEVRTVSRLLNAVSVSADMNQLEWLDRQDFVREIKPVLLFKRKLQPPEPKPDTLSFAPTGTWLLDYGPSEGQLDQIRVIPLHEEGYSGAGVWIGVFDTGFWTDHEAFNSMNIHATYDFINNDPDVSDNDSQQEGHGTSVLGAVGGAAPGHLYGPAYGATFILAKTEDVTQEVQQEEDYYIAALEWADSIGCDIVTSSLGYSDWYTFEDMDGNTAPITVACDLAAAAGITVNTSAGNERTGFGHITAPADGDSVIAVGAVTPNGFYASFSSPGPTFDGQIKPDICARGTGVTSVTLSGGYTNNFSGTSASAPLSAGAIALLLEMHPDWGPMDVRSVLWATGQHLDGETYPNNDYGYGLIDAAAASGITPATALAISVDSFYFTAVEDGPNPDPRTIEIAAEGPDVLEWSATNSSNWLTVEPSSGTTPDSVTVAVDISLLESGIYLDLDTIVIVSDSASNSPQFVEVRLDVIHELCEDHDKILVGPNPFDTWVEFTFPRATSGGESIYIFAVDGSKVLEKTFPQEICLYRWTGNNDSGNEAADGMYLVRITGFGDDRILKVLKVRQP